MREVCAATGLLGEDIGPVFPEHDFFVDFFTRYYTDVEPQSALVVEAGGKVVGYLLGCTDFKRYRRYQMAVLGKAVFFVLKGLYRGSFGPPARRFFRWLLIRGWREVPKCPGGGAHFHFNLLRPWRDASTTRRLVDTFLDILSREHPGIKVVWGQMETFGARRSSALFHRLGWQFYDQVPLSKYRYLFGSSPPPHLRKLSSGEVYLTTIYRTLS
ncbi:MAG: GNAT family acetyltransferase [Thermoanaerobacteraceae bacterium]|nr:GNAT family acetyltransferase [Thermoanaerobacteraceae bacterium]